MSESKSVVVVKPLKQITMTSHNSKRWDVEFEGIITRRDIVKVYRSLRVNFARVQRHQSALKMIQEREQDRKVELAKQKDISNG